MIHCCVIGGAGFIGRKVVDVLLASNRRVSVVGRSDKPLRPLPRDVHYYSGDIADGAFMAERFRDADEVIDLAYSSVPKTSFEDPVKDILHNLPPSVSMLEIACATKIKKMVMVSSGGTIYGEPRQLPISENHSTDPISPYGITKLALEKYALMFHRLKGLPVLCVRPSNPYGEGQMPFIGQGFVATAIASILSGSVISIFGPQGTIRDYIYVNDLAQGIVSALNDGAAGECYNIGSGIGRNNLEVLSIIDKAAKEDGFNPKILHLPERKFDVSANVLDSSKLREISGWYPKADFEESIRRTFRWYIENLAHGNQ